MKEEYTKEKLIEICDKAIVPEKKWWDRDSFSAQKDVATVRALLIADCEFRILRAGSLITNDKTIWIELFYDEWEDGEDWHSYYLPTERRLEERKGGDWY